MSQQVLQAKLDALKVAFEAKAPRDKLATMQRATEELRSSGQLDKTPRAGDTLPSFVLPNQRCEPVGLDRLLADGPVVLAFFRGAWCPYCMIELQALNAALPAFRARGAELVAVTPQLPERSATMVAEQGFAFDILTDRRLDYAEKLGLAFTLPADLKAVYQSFGIDLAAFNGDPSWRLPMPARIVVAQKGRILDAQVDPDYTRRPDPAETLSVLSRLAVSGAGK